MGSLSPARGAPAAWRLALGALVLVTLGLGLFRATGRLDNTHHFDERFSLHNVSAVLVGRTLRPANAYYPSLSYLPQAALLAASERLHRWTGIAALAVFDHGAADGYSRTAYFLCRLLTVLYGAAAVALLFAVGRRLFDARVGLLAALFLAGTPGLLLAATVFKPDILVALLTLLTFAWALAAASAPGSGRFALAGVGVGLAVAAKYTGVGAALPVAAAALVVGRRDRRALGWLLLAGLASLVTFAALNPHLGVVLRFVPEVLAIYERKGAGAGGSHWEMAAREVQYLLLHHGWVVAGLAVWGCGALLVAAVRPRGEGGERRRSLLLLGYVLGYSALLAASTTLFKGQNYLPILPFTALLAAASMVSAWDWLRARLPGLDRRAVVVPAGALLALAVLGRPAQRAYQDRVPTTWDLAEREIAALPALDSRWVYREGETPPLRFTGRRPVTRSFGRLHDAGVESLDRGDVELFAEERRRGEDAAFYIGRQRTGRTLRLAPALFRARGPALLLVLHPWQPRGDAVPLVVEQIAARRFAVAPPGPWPECALVSLELRLPAPRGSPPPRWLEVDGRRLDLHASRGRGRRARLLTPRFALGLDAPVKAEVAFEGRGRPGGIPEVGLRCWAPPVS